MSDRTSSRVKEASMDDIQADLASLREDLGRLTEELGSALAAKGASTWRSAKESLKANLDDALAGAESTKDEAVDAVHGVSDAIIGAVEEAISRRPYPALALAVVLGFFCGMALKK